jgi:hypothetical protein
MKLLAMALLTLACSGWAANLDGKWTAELSPAAGKKAAAKKNTATPPVFMLDLKTQGGQLTGSVSAARAKRAREVDIQNGKVDGDHFTFTTLQHGKNGDAKFLWEGTLAGEQIKGTRTREGAKRGAKFAAKRPS